MEEGEESRLTDDRREDARGVLHSSHAGIKVIRGSAARATGYATSALFLAGSSVLLLRHLGVVDFGRYATVTSLIAIVSGVTDAGLTALGLRDLSLRRPVERAALLQNLLGIRLVFTPLGVLAAVLFTVAAGYGGTLVLGTAIAGAGLVLINAQATTMLSLSVDLKIGRVSAADVLRQASSLAAIGMLVAFGASLLPFFLVYLVSGLALIAATPLIVGPHFVWWPAFDREVWRAVLRDMLPVGAAVVMGVIYFRVLIILMSLLAPGLQTGLFATSFRVMELIFGVPSLVLSVALPLLAIAANDRDRLRYMLRRIVESSLLVATFTVVMTVILAAPVLGLLGGSQYRAAAPILQIQVFAVIPLFFGQALQLGLLAVRRQRNLVVANGAALIAVVALGLSLIPVYHAKGAAVAAVAAEALLALILLGALTRTHGILLPAWSFVAKLGVAGGLASLMLLIPEVEPAGQAIGAAVIYIGTILASRAVPSEILEAFRVSELVRRAPS
jgi:O-antigen/teichoic acid export membrane protein